MSGAGRKSGYRKSVTDAYEVGLPTPSSNEIIGKVKGCLGGNVFDIQFPQSSSSSSSSSSSTPSTTTSTSVVLPSRFRKVIWVKRGDYVIVDTGNNKDNSKDNSKDNNDNDSNDNNNDNNNNNNNDNNNCHYMIKHILNKDQIKHIKSIDLWPIEFDNDDGKKKDQGYGNDNDTMPGYQEQEEEEYYDDDDINEEDNSNNNNDNI